MVLGKPAVDGESPVDEILKQRAGSRVPRDTRNLWSWTTPKPKYSLVTDSEASTVKERGEKDPGRGEREPETLCKQAVKGLRADGVLLQKRLRRVTNAR